MDVKTIKNIMEISKRSINPEEFFNREYNEILLHELIHMASSHYDEKTGICLSGFDKVSETESEETNRGLTEGMTEVLAMTGQPGTVEISSGYYVEALIINQLIQIVEADVMLSSYFGNKGTTEIEARLNSIIDNPEHSYKLLRGIEANFLIKDIDCEQSLLGIIQTFLIDYFQKKIELVQNKVPQEDIVEAINIYEKMLITPEIIQKMKKILIIMLD